MSITFIGIIGLGSLSYFIWFSPEENNSISAVEEVEKNLNIDYSNLEIKFKTI